MDKGHTWGPVVPLREEPGWVVRTKPIVLREGDFLIPAYDEREWKPAFFISEDEGRPNRRPHVPCKAIQPAVVQLSDGSLLAYMRTKYSRIWEMRSLDQGRTWTGLRPTSLPNPNAAVELLRLRGGNLLLVFNDSDRERAPLVAVLSHDEGATWPLRRVLEAGEGKFSYPAAIQAPDGVIHGTRMADQRGRLTQSFNGR